MVTINVSSVDPAFGIHGVSATTMGATPCMIVNGPVRHTCEFNYKTGALGSGTRAKYVGPNTVVSVDCAMNRI